MFQLENISASYDGRQVLDIAGLELDPHEITVLLGHNGSGKSTLLAGLARQQWLAGQIRLGGKPLSDYGARGFARQVAYLPQILPPAPGLTLREMVLLARFPWRGALRGWTRADHAAADAAIERVGLPDYAEQLTDALSGGERQRGWIAAMIAQDTRYCLLDEPLSALDIPHQQQVMQLLRGLNRESGTGQLIILHDVNIAAAYADRIIALRQGRVVFDGGADALMRPEVLQQVYGLQPAILTHPDRQQPVAVF
ncbi:ABC transporter ATP-binding protein [Leisingera sp. ANG-Vp]|uniref:ABC transporter ATP-binding protein n=1 Tax=Leisingera sp. ANG-Vp TaxID=1577896 RepID=UPI00057F7538|nr:ABC transporter ATP-binding protein [Leisingera sp. ANG-Vp]KIC20345.1 hypothetical protein RA20_09015 [Leisingera sp. ANG-Vp]